MVCVFFMANNECIAIVIIITIPPNIVWNEGCSLIINQTHTGPIIVSKRKKRLTRDGNYNARGRYFPDGKSIFFVHGNDGNFQIATKKLSSRYIETLTSTSLDESPTISPNGNIIIYATKDGSKGYLGGITLDGKSRFSLPVKNGSVREPAWSPLLN